MGCFAGQAWMSMIPLVSLAVPAIATLPSHASADPTEHLPPNTPYTILIDMRDETWAQLNQYELFQQLQEQGMGSPNPGGLPFLPLELNYETDIAPWVGDTVAIALLPIETPTQATLEDNEILIAPLAEPEAFAQSGSGDEMLALISQLREVEPRSTTYQGQKIVYWEPIYFDEPAIELPELEGSPPPAIDEPTAPAEDAGPASETMPQKLLKAIDDKTDDDIDLLPTPILKEPGLAIAVFPDFMVAAETPTAIQTWMDRRPQQVANSLASNAKFQRTLAHPNYNAALGVVYSDVAELLQYPLTELILADIPFPVMLPSDLESQLSVQPEPIQTESNFEALIYPHPQGLRLQGRGYFNNVFLAELVSDKTPASPELLTYAPKDSYLVFNSQNIATAWQDIVIALEATEETQAYLDIARGFVMGFAGLDLDEDVFGWMDQGFSIFLYPTSDTPLTQLFPEFRVGLGIALQTSDRATAEATFTSLDGLMQDFRFAVETTALNDQAATSWGEPLGEGISPVSFFGRTWVDDDTVLLTTSIEALTHLAQLEPAQAVPNALRFVHATEDFPAANQGYLFANTAPMRSLFSSIFPPIPGDSESLAFQNMLASVQALSGTASYTDEYTQIDGLLLLAPAETP